MSEIIVQSRSNSCIAVNKENILLFTSDGAAYMLTTGKLPKECFPNMLHITCLTHALLPPPSVITRWEILMKQAAFILTI